MKSTYLSAARDMLITLASGIIIGSWLAGEVAALLPFGVALVLVIVAAILDVAAEIRRKSCAKRKQCCDLSGKPAANDDSACQRDERVACCG